MISSELAADGGFRAAPQPHRGATRHAWLKIVAALADGAFETDRAGLITGFADPNVLDQPAAILIGQPLARFCTPLPGAAGLGKIFERLHRERLSWRGPVTLQRSDGSTPAFQLSLAPKPLDLLGRAGAYGMLIDLSVLDHHALVADRGLNKAMLDPHTGLWTITSFAEEAGRRFDRLEVEGLPGTLLLLGFSRVPAVGQQAVATRLRDELREVIRPTDILGRINMTTFALWCDGMDDLTGSERAARFCEQLPVSLPGNPAVSVGLAARWPGSGEDPHTLIRRAGIALNHAERVARTAAEAGSQDQVAQGTWRVWNASLPS